MDTKNKTRKRKSVEKPLCKYGTSCYQKNSEHHKRFRHPSGTDEIMVKDINGNSLNDVTKMNLEEIEKDDVDKSREKSPDNQSDNENETDVIKVEETVQEILESFPKDFFDFWDFCSSVNSSNPEDAFSEFGYHLVGVYDLLSKNLPKDKKVDISCHWRYFYDTPEFQTVIMKTGKDLFHIGYFRDDPEELPSVLASNSANLGAKLTLMGDNIFAAMNDELVKVIKSLKSEKKKKADKIQKKLVKYASEKKYSMDVQTNKTKLRQKKVVAKTFHGFGIVVRVENDIGYRTLPESNASLKSILKKIVSADTDSKRLEFTEQLDEIITNVHFANDECDYGTGLELGIDLFCFGDTYFHSIISSLLSVAYNLLNRPKYASIIKAHLRNRRNGCNLSTLDV